jgi:Flp pilus assembly protein TadG
MLIRIRERLQRQDGVAAVEFAVVALVFLILLYGILTYGYIYSFDQSLNHAAEEGARAAIATTSEASAITTAQTVAYDRLAQYQPSLLATDIVATVADCDTGFRCITVTITYPWDTRPIIPKFVGMPTPDQIIATATVQLT